MNSSARPELRVHDKFQSKLRQLQARGRALEITVVQDAIEDILDDPTEYDSPTPGGDSRVMGVRKNAGGHRIIFRYQRHDNTVHLLDLMTVMNSGATWIA